MAYLCINADFEMAWSGRRKPDDSGRDTLFTGTDETVARILAVLDRYEIPITWSTVGALMLTHPFDFSRFAPYNGLDSFFEGDWYDLPSFGSERGRFFYAPKTFERILNTKIKHEVGCHTFTHIYLGGTGVSRERFKMELEVSAEIAAEWGLTLKSFVYPSQFNAYTDLLAEMGFTAYRFDALEWFRFGKPYVPSFEVRFGTRFRKLAGGLGKLIDERFCFTPKCFFPEKDGSMVKFINSTFLPGYHGVSQYVTAEQRVSRICRGIDRAVRENSVFSFFFHPWNFNKRRSEALDVLSRICAYAAKKREEDGLEIVTTEELAHRTCII